MRGVSIAFVAGFASIGCIGVLEEDGAESVGEVEQALTWQCTGDNDWAGSTACFSGSWKDGVWSEPVTSTGYYGDMRYSTDPGAFAGWQWQPLPYDGTLEFWVYIPSPNGEAMASYAVGCGAHGFVGEYTINQYNISNTWVKLATAKAWSGNVCTIHLYRPLGLTTEASKKKLAWDAARLKIIH